MNYNFSEFKISKEDSKKHNHFEINEAIDNMNPDQCKENWSSASVETDQIRKLNNEIPMSQEIPTNINNQDTSDSVFENYNQLMEIQESEYM